MCVFRVSNFCEKNPHNSHTSLFAKLQENVKRWNVKHA